MPSLDIRGELERFRKELLDTSARNSLIKYRASRAKSVPVVDELPDQMFEHLVTGNRPFRIEAAAGSPRQNESESPKASELPRPPRRGEAAHALHRDDILQVDLGEEEMERRLKGMKTFATTELEETGGSSLFLAIGFLEWYDSTDSSDALTSPLFLIPVEIERAFNARKRRYGYTLRHTGNEIQANLSLTEKLKRDLGIVLPDIEPDVTPDTYFAEVAAAVSSEARWKVKREAVISFFTFAKLLMFRDLDPDLWPEESSIESKPLVRAIFEGQASESDDSLSYAQDHAIDAVAQHRDMLLAVDADGSQHSALIDVLAGKSMVIEGPPGTGKSQTITNMIAAAISQGKTVLFVAEKMAALEVVHKNLSKVGLGHLCLEMHSHKSKPSNVYASLKERINASFKEPGTLHAEMSQLQTERDSLEAYITASCQPVGPGKEPLFKLFWHITALRSRGAEPLAIIVDTRLSHGELQERLRFFAEIGLHTNEIGPSERELWTGFAAVRYYAGDRPRALVALEQLLAGATSLERASKLVADGQSQWPDLKWAERIAGSRPELSRPANLMQSVCSAIASGMSREEAFRHITVVKRLKAVKTSKPEVWKLAASEDTSANCRRALDLLRSRQVLRVLKKASIDDLRHAAAEFEGVLASFERLKGVFERAERLRLGRPRNPEQLDEFAKKYRCLNDAVVVDRSVIRPELFFPATRVALAQAEKRRDEIQTQAAAHEQSFLFRECPSRETLGHLRRRLKAPGSGMLRWLSADYRKANAEVRAFRRGGAKIKSEELPGRLDALDDHLAVREAFASESKFKQTLGPGFKGMDSEWESLRAQVQWAQRTMGCGMAYQTVMDLTRSIDEDAAPPTVEEVDNAADLVRRTLSTPLLQSLLGAVGGVWTTPFVEILQSTGAFAEQLRQCLALIDEFVTLRFTDLEEARATLSEILEVRAMSEQLRLDRGALQVFGTSLQAEESDTVAAETTLEWTDLVASAGLPELVQSWLFAKDSPHRADTLADAFDATAEGWKQWSNGWSLLSSMGDLTSSFAGASPTASWKAVGATFEQMTREIDSLLSWANLCRELERGSNLSLLPFLEGILAGSETASRARERFEVTFFGTVAQEAIRGHDALTRFSRQRMELTRTAFKTTDLEVIGLARRQMAYNASRRAVPAGNATGRVRDLTELSLIRNEIQKTRAHCKLRQLMSRAPRAVQALKPCFMMSPLTVAQHLPAGEVEFDLVIMDEASQIKPADAMGTIARAKQIVIVGDPKQLPPTSFFERGPSDDQQDPDETTMADDAESILEVALKAFPHKRRLRWHYRSQHESLIAFSNERFYDRELVIFPSPTVDAGRLGIRHHFVNGATYSGSKNLLEAQALAQAIARHAIACPDETLGIGVFNMIQRDLVQECLDQICIKDPRVRAAVEKLQGGEEGLFIKNLENLQGDERDVIFIGYTYGPETVGGRVQNRFGPITGAHGWRRLNVLITRARCRLEVFASMRSEDIFGGPEKSLGVNAMKDFLTYVETGKLVDRGVVTGREPDSPFEEAVGRVIGKMGMAFVPQVGVAGYFLDIGVLVPGRNNEFILGIECDGATYHSAKSARDRDRLREDVIRKRGWNIHRIWSTDWFLNQHAEERRLAQALTAAKKAWELRTSAS